MTQKVLEGKELEDLSHETREVLDHEKVNLEHFLDRLEGRDGGLRPSKPGAKNDTGLEKYVWRMARFHSGADPSMPVTAGWDLDQWLENEGIDAKVSGIRDETGKEIEAVLDLLARIVVNELGGNPNAGLGRWGKALYG